MNEGIDFSISLTLQKYYRGDVVATRYYRRIVSPAILGKFESDGQDTEEFKAFANTIGAPELLKKTTIEFAQAGDGKDGKYIQKVTEEGDATVHESTFAFGNSTLFEIHGHKINVSVRTSDKTTNEANIVVEF